ncbi:cardiolipin synthase ClsB, partial [Pseudomonas aeruginosa]|nr:cardiolipin synthase ClsB [Pseudomonas aeruginosa]
MNFPWRDGNRVELLINGEEYFPRLFQCIAEARREILLETFIIFEDEVGRQLQEALSAAAERGVEVQVTVDGYGTASLSPDYLARLTAAGVRVHLFDPRPRLLGMRTNLFRRLHRKLVVIDRQQAFVGGINYGEDHLVRRGNMAKQDYAVRVEGPVVRDIRQACLALLEPDADYPPLRPSGAGQP